MNLSAEVGYAEQRLDADAANGVDSLRLHHLVSACTSQRIAGKAVINK